MSWTFVLKLADQSQSSLRLRSDFFLVLKPPGWKHSIPCQCNFALCRLCLLGTLCAASVFPSAQVDTWMVRSLFSTSAYWLPLMLRLSGMFFIFFCSLDYQIVVLCISHFFQRLFLIPKIYWSVFLILLPAFGRCCLAAHGNPLQLLLLCWILAAAIVFGGIEIFVVVIVVGKVLSFSWV